MEAFANQVVDLVNGLLWGKILIWLLVGCGVWFTLRLGFIQVRHLGHTFTVLRGSRQSDASGISSFQALCTSLAARVGTGNLAGVAVAIYLGGPGAVFWMWLIAFIGMATAFVESTLAQLYKVKDEDGNYRGGPAYYMERGLGMRWMGVVFSLCLLLAFGLVFNAVQANSISLAMNVAFGIPDWVSGLALVVLSGLIIFGGIRRIAKWADVLVPVMAFSYLGMALFVIGSNFGAVPETFGLIFRSAFGLEQAFAGGIGAAILMGVKRGLFSNEAGLGSAPNVAAVAYVRHPASQGIVQAFSVFIDTLIVCSCTAFIVLLGDVYQPGMSAQIGGVALTQASLAGLVGEWGRVFVSIALMLFGFTTIIYNYYLGENSLSWFSADNRGLVVLYRTVVIALCGWGATTDLGTVFAFADVTMGLLAICNLIALVLLFKVGLRLMRDYDSQIKAGVE